MPGRIVLLVTSPRLPAGLLTAQAWDLVRAYPVFAATETGQSEALRARGADVTIVQDAPEALLGAVRDGGTVVWLAGPAGDEDLARRIGLRLTREPHPAELELMYGSWDPAGARLLDAVSVMDRLVAPGGDPWKRQQTHASLARYLLEEAYEAVDAIDAGDYAAFRDELGDILLQILLHARLAAERDEDAFTIDDVAGAFVAKMIRRNPHVFGDAETGTVDEITEQWERIKAVEQEGRSPMDSIALGQPALSLAAKIQARAARAGLPTGAPDDGLAERLWRLVGEAVAADADPETELRAYALHRLAGYRK